MSPAPTSSYTGASAEISALIDVFRRMPKEAHRAIRPALRDAGSDILQTAALNAMWSSRIPHALSLRVSLAGRRPGVFVRVDSRAAPHARSFEGILSDEWRHPVYGNERNWVAQRARPFLLPAVEETGPRVRERIAAALDEAIQKSGF